ncbi:MAG: amino acid decarboxylase [Candidatus Heimdallarchaeota archaeon]|nr:amino acid decarboxylase [Candidatus Heimdallarchaeota archaeon]
MKDINLDPVDWEKFEALGHKMITDMTHYLKNIKEQKIWQPIPDEMKDEFKQILPKYGTDLEKVYEEFNRIIKPYNMGNVHPRFWAWVNGTGTPGGVLAEMLTAMLNPNSLGGNHAANYIEDQVVQWAIDFMGYDRQASGLMVSGGSMGNFIGLTVARNVKAGYDIITQGVATSEKEMIFYGSNEMHSSLDKSMQLLGLGYNSLRKISVNEKYEIDTQELKKSIEKDIEDGKKPICIIANVGTVNTGAVDDLIELSRIAKKYDLWLHADGAFGAMCKLSEKSKHLVEGIELADSLTFDFHKWMYVQYEASMILVKNKNYHYKSFSITPDYLVHQVRGLSAGSHWHSDYGLQLSRGFKALKIWMTIKEHGITKFGEMVEQNIQQAKYLTRLIEENENFELLSDGYMNIVNFRYVDADIENLDKFNAELIFELHERGIAIPSNTMLKGKFSIRIAISNQRSRREDFDILITSIEKIARELL